jgi:hypothetical protein
MSLRDDIYAIEQLKYRYFRFLDQKKMDDLEQLLLPECTASYHGGRHTAPNRTVLMEFLRRTIGSQRMVSMHHGHHPEITLQSDTEATGIWYLHDIVLDFIDQTRLEGNGFYEDRYQKVGDTWKILHTGYDRTFLLIQPLGEVVELFNGFAK